MKLLFDENIGHETVQYFISLGYDVIWVAEKFRGASDKKILQFATQHQMCVVTLDKDFASLVFFDQWKPFSVILLRLVDDSQKNISSTLAHTFEKIGTELGGLFIVVTDTTIRTRRMYDGASE